MNIENPLEEELKRLSEKKNKIEFQIINLQQKLSVSIIEEAKKNDTSQWEEDKERRFKEEIKSNPIHKEIAGLKISIDDMVKKLEILDGEYNVLNEIMKKNMETWSSPIASLSVD